MVPRRGREVTSLNQTFLKKKISRVESIWKRREGIGKREEGREEKRARRTADVDSSNAR